MRRVSIGVTAGGATLALAAGGIGIAVAAGTGAAPGHRLVHVCVMTGAESGELRYLAAGQRCAPGERELT